MSAFDLGPVGPAGLRASREPYLPRRRARRLYDLRTVLRADARPEGDGGFTLAVLLEVTLADLQHDEAQELTDAAHQVCPCSNATRRNIDVTVTVVEDD